MPQLYLDCDGVLADFDTAAAAILHMAPRAYQHRYGLPRFWKMLAGAPDFYARIPLMADARELFDGVRHLDPIILTGCSRGGWAEDQKRRWAAEHSPARASSPAWPRKSAAIAGRATCWSTTR